MNAPSNSYQESTATRVSRCRQVLNNAILTSTEIDKHAVHATLDIAKEKTQYLEKLSLGCGATVALIVSFVGAHAGHLQPEWLLRLVLVVLVFAMMFGFLRNWIFPWYSYGTCERQVWAAKLKTEYARKDLISTGTALFLADGNLIDVETWLRDFDKTESTIKSAIDRFKKMEERGFDWANRAEYLTLGLASIGMVLLVALAWNNF
jgi:hypothetical protein